MDDKIITFPGNENTEPVEEVVTEAPVGEETPEKMFDENSEEVIIDVSAAQMQRLMEQVEVMVRTMEQQWIATKKEFDLKDDQMKMLYNWNEQHRTQLADDATDEEQEAYDRFNGLDSITEDEVVRIFGEEHKIIGIEHSVTVSRIKDAVRDFFSWMSTLREYRDICDGYRKLQEIEERKQIEVLKVLTEKEEDPDKKAKMQGSIDLYFERKYLGFLARPIDPKVKNAILIAAKDEKKINYWITRATDKLHQLKVSPNFIMEIERFEPMFLPEKYHKYKNILLLYFLNLVVYGKMTDEKGEDRNKAFCMIFGLDSVIRNICEEEDRMTILGNIMALLNQFNDDIPDGSYNPTTIAPEVQIIPTEVGPRKPE